MITDTNKTRNRLIKDLAPVLKKIDTRVEWIDYLPKEKNSFKKDFVVLSINHKIKYINVSKLSPFDYVNRIMGALDDYRLDIQFISEDTSKLLSKELTYLYRQKQNQINNMIENLLFSSDTECKNFLSEAINEEILHRRKSEQNIPARKILTQYLLSNNLTLLDIDLLQNIYHEIKKPKIEKLITEETDKEL